MLYNFKSSMVYFYFVKFNLHLMQGLLNDVFFIVFFVACRAGAR